MKIVQTLLLGLILLPFIVQSDDYPDDASTRVFLSIGSTITGTTESLGEEDWFKTILVAGRQYTFINGVITSDPRLSIRGPSPSQTQVGYNDDCCGSHSASQIIYTPSTTGIYFLVSMCYSIYTGNYKLGIADSSYSPECTCKNLHNNN